MAKRERPRPCREDVRKMLPLSMRVSDRARFGLECAARVTSRSLGGYAQWAIEDSLAQVKVLPRRGTRRVGLDVALQTCWHPEPAIRAAFMANNYPYLLSTRERYAWSLASQEANVWHGALQYQDGPDWELLRLNYKALIAHWPLLLARAAEAGY